VAAHDAEIAVLAATEDGRVAASADRHGAMRLWPSLEGKREPVVVDSDVVAEQLAIVRDDAELVIAAAGAQGELALIRTTAGGEPISHTRVDLERTLLSLHAIASGFVGLRDDQTIVGAGLHGGRLAALRPGPGERIAGLASRRGRVLAFVHAEDGVRARWIEAGEQLAWGSESPTLPIDPLHAVLAPDHERVAALAADGKTLVMVSLTDGGLLGRPLTANFVQFPVTPLGFLDDRTVALASARRDLGWWHRGEWKEIDISATESPAVVTDRQLITVHGGCVANLKLDTLEGTKFLGFRLLDVRSLVRRGDGWVISDGISVLGIDRRMVAHKHYRLEGPEPIRPDDIVLLDDRHWIVVIAGQAYLLDLEHPEDRVSLAPSGGRIQYERTTRLIAIGGTETQWIARYDPKAGAIRETLELHKPDWIELLDPATHHGDVARKIVAHDSRATLATVTAIRAIDFGADPPLREGRSYETGLPEEIVMELAGRTLRGTPSPGRIAAGVASLLPAVARQRISPDGSLIATVAGGRLTLRDREGSARWAAALPGAAELEWSGSKELVAFGSGMARIDAATGAPLDRRCGWEFGLWGSNEAVCDVGARLCEAP
jgi:hypothetical protein